MSDKEGIIMAHPFQTIDFMFHLKPGDSKKIRTEIPEFSLGEFLKFLKVYFRRMLFNLYDLDYLYTILKDNLYANIVVRSP